MMGSSDRRRIAAAHELYARSRKSGDLDAAYCAASVLGCLDADSVEHRVLVRTYEGRSPMRPGRVLDEFTLTKLLRDPLQDEKVTALLAAMAPALAAWQATTPPVALPSCEPSTFASTHGDCFAALQRVRAALGVEMPELCPRPKDPGRAIWLNSKAEEEVRPQVVLFSDLLAEVDEGKLHFDFGRGLMTLRPAQYAYLSLDYSHRNVDCVLRAHLSRADGGSSLTVEQAAILQQIDGRLSVERRAFLRRLATQISGSKVKLDAQAWTVGIHLTRHYTGLLLSGDLAAALEITRTNARRVGQALSVDETEDAILDYALSPRYLEARRRLRGGPIFVGR